MALEIYATFDGVSGESQKAGVEGWIEMFSFSNGSSNHSGVATGTGSGTGKVEFTSISCTTQLEVSTPKLFNFNWSGKHIANGTIIVRESTGDTTTQPFYQYVLKEVFVDSVSVGGAGGGGKPSVNYSFSFNFLEVKYWQQANDGSLTLAGDYGWNLTTNKSM